MRGSFFLQFSKTVFALHGLMYQHFSTHSPKSSWNEAFP